MQCEPGDLTADDLEEMLQTPAGALRVMPQMERARLGMAANQLVGFLEYELDVLRRPITGSEANDMANIVHWCLRTASDKDVLQHIRQCEIGMWSKA